jgi:hypothetical protein
LIEEEEEEEEEENERLRGHWRRLRDPYRIAFDFFSTTTVLQAASGVPTGDTVRLQPDLENFKY